MVAPRPLKNAPIKEAIIDLRTQLAPAATIQQLKELHPRIKDDYPHISERRRWQGKFNIKEGVVQQPESQDLGISGYLCKSKDEKYVAQFKLDGFTLSRLPPYTNWEAFRSEAKRLWEVYASVGVQKIERVATRHINVLDIPLPITRMEDYLTSLPPAPVMNLGLVSFLNRLQVVDPSKNFSAIITQAIQPPSNPSVATILLDIDAFSEAPYVPPFNKAWETLEALRHFKNELFFNLITDETAALFQK